MVGLKLKAKKCSFGLIELVYLGHVISTVGLRLDPNKLQAIRDFPCPANLEFTQSFIGLVNHYRRFVRDFATIATLLYKLLKKDITFTWGTTKQNSFELLKVALCFALLLVYPNFVVSFLLQTDTSRDAIGAILSQIINGQEKIVAYASRCLSKSEKKYGINNKEGLPVIFGVKHYCPYLHGSRFTIETNHASLCALITSRDLKGHLARWAVILQSYYCEIIHKLGRLHRNVDALTRMEPPLLEPYSQMSDLFLHCTSGNRPWTVNCSS